jgi:hypothetical protein
MEHGKGRGLPAVLAFAKSFISSMLRVAKLLIDF